MERNGAAGGDGTGTAAAGAWVVSVQVGKVTKPLPDWEGRPTAIDKRPVDGTVGVGRLGLAGDEHGEPQSHGGVDQAIYLYGQEDLEFWSARLGRELHPGQFGENVTVRGIDVNAALVGERWRVGSALLELTASRVPCVNFRGWMGEEGWVRRFTEAGRPGAYARVLEEGTVTAGDPVEVVFRPPASITVAEALRAYHGDADLLRRLLALPGVAAKWHRVAERVLQRKPT